MTDDLDQDQGRDDAKVSAIAAAVLGVVLAIGAAAVAGGQAALSVIVGATIAVANLVMMRAIVRALLPPPEPSSASGGTTDADAPPPDDGDADDGDRRPAGANPGEAARAGRRGGAAWGVFALLKIAVLFGGVWFLLTRGWVDPIPLVVGYGVLPLGIATSALVANLSPRPRRRR